MTRTRARIALTCLAVALLAGTAQAAAPGGTLTYYTGTGIEHARGIVAGPDGAVWFTNRDDNSVGRITTDGSSITRFADTSIGRPYVIVVGPDDALWFTNQDANSISRITTAGVLTHFHDATMVVPTGITVGPDDALWFANDGGSIGRITTEGVVSNFTDPAMVTPFFIVSGPDGALWYSDQNANAIGRITTGGAVTTFTDPSIKLPRGITVGPDGALWFSNQGNNSIGRITTDGVVRNFTAKGVSAPYGITAGPDGALWFANQTKNSIGRITTSGRIQLFGGKNIANPVGITVGPDGGIWFTNADNDSLGRIEPFLPEQLSTPGGDAADTQVSADGKGNAVAVWTRSDGTNTIVQAAIRRNGGEFGNPIDLSAAGEDATEPQVALDPKGNAVVVWTRSDGTNTLVESKALAVSKATAGPLDTLSEAGEDATAPQVSIDGKGNAVAVWSRSDGVNTIIQSASRILKSGIFTAPIDLSAAGNDASDAQVSVDAKGNAAATWSLSDGLHSVVQAAFRPASKPFGPAVDVSTGDVEATEPQVSLDGRGIAHVVFTATDGLNVTVQGSVGILKSYVFNTPVDLSDIGETAANPQIAADPNGNAVAVWESTGDLGTIVQSAFSPAKTQIFGIAVDLSFAGHDASDPQVAMDAKGNAMAVWSLENGLGDAVQGALRAVKSGQFSLPSFMSASDDDSTEPQVDFDASGTPVTVWTGSDGTDDLAQATDDLA